MIQSGELFMKSSCKDEGFTAYFDYSWQWAYKERFEKAV